MKKTLLLIIVVAISSPVFLYTQELADLEIQTIPLQKIEMTEYGIVAHYVTSYGKGAGIFLPLSWFRLPKPGEETTVRAYRRFAVPAITNSPFLKVVYANGKLSKVELMLSMIYDNANGIPSIEGKLPQEIASKFQEQEQLDYLMIE